MKDKNIIFVMGVSGCGKSSVGTLISKEKSYRYEDADNFHPIENVEKMRSGIPLTDSDRKPWLHSLNQMATICNKEKKGLVVACSCLKPEYRMLLQEGIQENVLFIYLKGSFEVISERMKKRAAHYFSGDEMLRSQFQTLIEPRPTESIDYVEIDIDSRNLEEVVDIALKAINGVNYAE